MILIESAKPIGDAWKAHVERIQNRIKEDPNEKIAGYDLNLRFMHNPDAAGRMLLKLANVIEGAKGEARTHKRKVALGSLAYAITKAFEEEECLRPAE